MKVARLSENIIYAFPQINQIGGSVKQNLRIALFIG